MQLVSRWQRLNFGGDNALTPAACDAALQSLIPILRACRPTLLDGSGEDDGGSNPSQGHTEAVIRQTGLAALRLVADIVALRHAATEGAERGCHESWQQALTEDLFDIVKEVAGRGLSQSLLLVAAPDAASSASAGDAGRLAANAFSACIGVFLGPHEKADKVTPWPLPYSGVQCSACLASVSCCAPTRPFTSAAALTAFSR